MALIGYARVSTHEQTQVSQLEALRTFGCTEVIKEHASGGDRDRPQLAKAIDRVKSGDTLVVVRVDRLARSLSHLLTLIEQLETKGAHFCSVEDPIDTASAQGKFTLQVLGAAAEFERALIRERTIAGLDAARADGRTGGNPGLMQGDRATLTKLKLARQNAYLERLNRSSTDWVPHVRRLRPDMPWEDVVRVVNAPLPPNRYWTEARLKRAARAYVENGFLEPAVLSRARRSDADDRLPAIVAGIKGASSDITLQEICDRLSAMREHTPRGKSTWYPSSVRAILKRAEKLGLL